MKKVKGGDLIKHLRDFAGGPLLGIIIGMFTVPVTTRLISPEEFGKSSLFTLAQTFFTIFTFLGMDQAFVRYYNSNEFDKKNVLINSIILPLACCSACIPFIIIFRQTLSFWLFGRYEPVIIILFCFFLPFLIVNRFAFLIIRMDLRGKLYSFLTILSQIINFSCLFFLLLFFERSFRSIIYATIISTFINTFILFLFTRESWFFGKNKIDKRLIVLLLQFSVPLIPATLLSWLFESFDKIGLKLWSTYEQVGLYAAAFKIVSVLMVIQNIFTTTWVPVAYQWHENEEDYEKFDQVSTAVLALMSIAFAGMTIFRDGIMLFLGAEYRNASSIFVFLLFIPIFYTISETTTLGIVFSKRTIFNLYVSIISVVTNAIGNYLLIPCLGAKGAAVSTAVSYLLFFLARTLFSRKLWYKFKLNKYLINILLLITLVILIELKMPKYTEIIVICFIIAVNYFFLTSVGLIA
jgi:O-antigen/teichoic acid export membrane protein